MSITFTEIVVDVHVLVHHTHQLVEAFILYSLGIAGLDVLKIFFVLLVGIITQAFDQVHRQKGTASDVLSMLSKMKEKFFSMKFFFCLVGVKFFDVDLEFIIGFAMRNWEDQNWLYCFFYS